ncbi:MAG: hypothetical protein ACT4P3_06975 [Betaproteobacteria bacterium]
MLVKLAITALVTVVLLLQMDGIGTIAQVALERTLSDGELLVLLAPIALSIYKPRGVTAYGWRNQQQPG